MRFSVGTLFHVKLMDREPFDREKFQFGWIWPIPLDTIISERYVGNLRETDISMFMHACIRENQFGTETFFIRMFKSS